MMSEMMKTSKFEKPSKVVLLVMLVKQEKVSCYKIVYKLLKLVLVLSVATDGVEKVSIMNLLIKKREDAR
jgi:hypothetical protein